MKVIRPIPVTASTLYSSDLAEPSGSDPSAWSSGTTYSVGQKAYLASTHRVYQSVQAGNINHDPATDTTATWWLNIGGTNKWAMFDEYVGTASVRAASLTVVINPGVVDSLYLYGMVGDTCVVTMRDGVAGSIVYQRTLTLLTPKIADWYAYYFEPYRQVPYFVLTDLPPYANGYITIAVTNSTADAQIGMCLPGRTMTVGLTQYGATVGIRDYSKKNVDATSGLISLVQGKFAKTLRAQARLFSATYAEVHSLLEGLRATGCVWVGDDVGGIEPLTVYGFYKDFSLLVDLPSGGVYTLEIEGIV